MANDWPVQYAEFWQNNPRSPFWYAATREAAMQRLIRHIDDLKAKRQAHETDDEEGQELGKLEFLRGPDGQRDRDTLWQRAAGTLPGTGAGGLKEGWLSDE